MGFFWELGKAILIVAIGLLGLAIALNAINTW